MSKIKQLLEIDEQITLWFNHTFYSDYIKWFMIFLSEEKIWFFLSVIYIAYIIIKKDKYKYPIIGLAILSVTIIDLLSFRILKPYFERLRPCYQHENVINLISDSCGSDFGFPSNHAGNTMGIAWIIAYFLPLKYRIIPIFFSVLVGISRVYLGVHFFGDILFGFFVGALVSSLLLMFFKLYRDKKSKVT